MKCETNSYLNLLGLFEFRNQGTIIVYLMTVIFLKPKILQQDQVCIRIR
jgi:hypothetical protein